MKNTIIKALKDNKNVVDWTLDVVDLYRDELYLIGSEVEAIREIKEETYSVTILIQKTIENKVYTGKASIDLMPNTNENEINKRIEEAVYAASLALNPFYTIDDKKESDEDYKNFDNRIITNRKNIIFDMKDKISNIIKKETQVKLASAEIFLTHSKIEFITSKGLDYSYNKTKVMLEMIFLTSDGKKEIESYVLRNERDLDLLGIETLVSDYISNIKKSLNADIPKTKKQSVFFTEEALDNFFDYYIYKTLGGAIYNKTSNFKVNEEVVKNVVGNKITLSYDPKLKGGLATNKYDEYGTLLEKFTVIDDGIFKEIVANKRFAEYLNCRVTGSPSNLVIKEGNKSFDELLEEGDLLVSDFSTFSPNQVTGAFSGEIRIGKMFTGGKFIPIKGGSVTGVMSEAMKEVYFSKELLQRGSYFGPKYIKVCNINITGK